MTHARLALIPLSVAAVLTLAAPALAQQNWVQGTPYLVVETGKRYNRLQDALRDIGDGKGTIRIDPGRWDDCGVQEKGDVTFEAAVPGKTFFVGPRVCETKAALVLRGRAARVNGIVFSNFHLEDGNSAGIRLEKGNLTVNQAWFHDSDEGILAGNDPKSWVVIDKSTFTHLGRCGGDAACAHAIYINFFDRVTVTRSRFDKGNGGHYLKVRAPHVTIENNLFDDTEGRTTNYMIDLPEGANGHIAGNWFTQGAHKENPNVLIAVSAEERKNPVRGLVIENNVAHMAPGALPTNFIGDWAGEPIVARANQLAGGIQPYQRMQHW